MAKVKNKHIRESKQHDETCMCKRCRAKIEAVFYRKRIKRVNYPSLKGSAWCDSSEFR